MYRRKKYPIAILYDFIESAKAEKEVNVMLHFINFIKF